MKNFPVAIRSMTAYGEASSTSPHPHKVIVQSVNRRFLEVTLNLPPSLASFEAHFREWIGSYIGRGQLTLTVIMKNLGEKIRIIPNLTLAKEIKQGWDLIAKELNISGDFSLSLLAQEKSLFFYEELDVKESYLPFLKESVIAALTNHCHMREIEGKNLLSDIVTHLSLIETFFQNIENLKDKVVLLNREKMKKRISELFTENIEERVMKEAALLSEKVDITEEIVRFHSLFSEFRSTLMHPMSSCNDTKGKKLEFLLQELSREINTIGSKAMNVDISKNVVDIKSSLEKIREQVQNIE